GVGARDLRECLLLQLTYDMPHRELVRRLITDHLEDIPHNRLPAIEKATRADIATIKEAIEVVRHMNPKPGSAFMPETIPFVVPGLQVERNEQGEYEVKLLDDWLPNIHISQRYIELYKELHKDRPRDKKEKGDKGDKPEKVEKVEKPEGEEQKGEEPVLDDK